MSDSSLETVQMRDWITRLRAGDRKAADELLHRVGARLEHMASRMLRNYPRVCQLEQTGTVLQNSLLRLLRALQEVDPASVREFFDLAALQMRRELLDLARRRPWHAPLEIGASGELAAFEPAAPAEDPAELARWEAFHAAVEKLPNEEREVVGLVFYHGWSQTEVAELFQVNERTIRRYWQSACANLHASLTGQLPNMTEQ